MKILSVVEAFCHGGAQTVLLDLVLSLPEHQHRVVHFSRANGIAPEATFLDQLRRAGIECVDTHWNSLRQADVRAEFLDGFSPDVVMFHWWEKDPLMPWVLAPRPDGPVFICVMHHAVHEAKSGYDRYVLVSRSQLLQVDHIAQDRVQIIPNGIEVGRLPIRAPRAVPVDARHPFVVGRLSDMREGKIPANWVSMLASFGLENTHFVIAGDGALLPKLREEAAALHLDARVSFPGYIPRNEVPALLRTFDVFCYGTSFALECCPLSILEAMAAGVPVVAEARGGIPEIVIHGENGLLAHSIDEIGTHLRRLRDDAALRERLALGARATAQRLSLANQIASYRDLLCRLMGERDDTTDLAIAVSMEKHR